MIHTELLFIKIKEVSKFNLRKDEKPIKERQDQTLKQESIMSRKNSKLSLSKLVDQKTEELKIPEVSLKGREKLINWLISIKLIKENINNLPEKLHRICKSGVIFADLINRLETRGGELIKGIQRKGSNLSYIRTNYSKIFDYLTKFEKFNKR